ncbi:sensor histidine kinase [Defluviitalea phaphyphila]|uniref:sensor histidine kinase n=1 Tax=Defluviitalea phaphyphila TaxID=1473580 RepID=UPI00072FEB98|nr:sensor histidine kinase [Defluviitalea phaphyphila]
MGKINLSTLMLGYFREKIKTILLFIIYIIIFVIVCTLYQLNNLSQILYAVIICLFISFNYLVVDFINYRKHILKIHQMYINKENLLEFLPETKNLKELKYQEIIKSIFMENQNLIFNTKLKETEMMDYYTLWVHQIKTPIAAIKLLLNNNKDKKFSYKLEGELFKVEQYLEMLLHYLRLESMSSDMLLKEYELNDIVKQAVKKYGLLFINKKLSFNIEDFSLIIVTDEKWLTFCLEQLISNAIKYTPKGGISIYLENKSLVIEDTGIGIKDEDLPRIFERGFTGYNGRMDKKSTGLGLYLCKQILDTLSHGIKVESKLGKGTKIFIDFSNQTHK